MNLLIKFYLKKRKRKLKNTETVPQRIKERMNALRICRTEKTKKSQKSSAKKSEIPDLN
jgi:hypothetical protein